MSWIQKTIPVPQKVDLLMCDGCRAEDSLDGEDSVWTKLSVDRGAAIFHFCATCRPVALNLLREGFAATSSEALKAYRSTPTPTL